MEVVINYAPRPLQTAMHVALEQHRMAVAVCHRAFGKTTLAINHLQKAALTCRQPRPRYAYIAPTFTQGKSIAWDYMRDFSVDIPGRRVNESELRIDYPNGGQVRIYGADNPDRLRGLHLDGAVLDEFGLMPPRTYSEVVGPALRSRQGWAFFIGTPNGKNEFYKMAQQAKADPEWYYVEYKASQTGILSKDELARARAAMTADEYAQEYECSFEASVKGAIYSEEMLRAYQEGRITQVPYTPALGVDTDWDLGVDDATAIWFSQAVRGSGEIRIIDYLEATGKGLNFYKRALDEKPYTYRDHWAPHDIQVRELTSGQSRLDTARALGLNFQIAPRIQNVAERIHATRMILPRCYFDGIRCQVGIEALQGYRWKMPTINQTGQQLPIHDWASHGADAFGAMALRFFDEKHHPERQAGRALRQAQRDDGEPFQWAPTSPRRRGGY